MGRRPGTPTDKLTNSLGHTAPHSCSPSPFLHGPAMMSPSHTSRYVGAPSPSHAAAESGLTTSGKHRKLSEKSMMSPFRKRPSVKNEGARMDPGKKADTPPIPAQFGTKHPSLTKSSSAYSPNSAMVAAEGGPKQSLHQQHKSSPVRSTVGGIKGIWKRNSRKKMAVKMESEEWVDVGGASEQSPSRELPRRLSLRRKNSVSGDKVC